MATEIKGLSPEAVWGYFYDLTQIPRPTGQTLEAQEYVIGVGKKLGLETLRDEVGNVLIRKPASKGMEDRPIVTLQAHLDMVPQKNAAKEHDFTKDPIDAYMDGEWVRARQTTLGADNGIGASYALAVLSDNTLKHGPIEALFTIDEEVGMVGAFGLKPGFSKGDILINLDSEEEGQIFIGCAGGVDVNATLEYKEEESPKDDIAVKISLTGLKGGHSGMDIILGRGNANKLLFRLIKEAVSDYGARLSFFEGGSLRNAIPREATAILTIPNDETSALWELVNDYQEIYRTEYKGIDEGITLSIEKVELPKTVVPEEVQDSIINAVEGCVNGVISMLQSFEGIVESSTNMAYVGVKDSKFEAKFLVRSSSETRKFSVVSSIESIMNMAGCHVVVDGAYNGWNPNIDSPILKTIEKAYKEIYSADANIQVIHAGLECGIIQGAMPDMDMVSIGPDILSPHSPDERVNIASVDRVWTLLKRVLEIV